MQRIPRRTLFGVITDFLLTRPTPEEIIAYRLPDDLAQRAHELLKCNDERGLATREEREELKTYLFIERLMPLLKAKVRAKQASNTDSA